ncbi:hypothetical protein BJ742DRAFT_827269 [Cladochytrium replicatum]|nr:hypothetical protein BJ742DRAFT_827269 [Cladochytrium replicatum]
MRLLSLLDGKIETFTSVENAPPFAAISYVWPTHLDPAITWTTANITLRSGLWATLHMKWSVPSCTPFQLDAALRAVYCAAIQVPDKDLPFSPVSLRFNHIWMDVLCIDQSSDDDKAKEVRYMRDYYSKAQSVYVFLNTLGQGDLPLLPEGPARWFQRLWTLQECVLPTNLYFYAMIPALNVSRCA